MNCLVTGGAGFIGSNLVDELLSQGHNVICLDKNKDGYWNDKANNHVGDITNHELVGRLMKNIDCVFHLAAMVQIQETIDNPVDCYRTNILGTAILLESARENSVSNFIFASTSAIYDGSLQIQKEGDLEDSSMSPYSSSKKSGEEMCKVYSRLFGLKTTILRFFNVYGDRQHSQGQYAPVIGIFMKQKNDGKQLTITGDGKQRRDFVNVKDVVRALILSQSNSSPGRFFNVGSGINYSVQDIADMISENQTYIEKRVGEAESTKSCIERIQKELNLNPEIKLENWLKKTLL